MIARTLTLPCLTGLLLVFALLPPLMTGAQDGPLFHVVPNNTLNLRACGSLDCAVVDRIQAGIRLPVYAVEGDWYQVRSKGRFLWLAGWLTTRVTPMPTLPPTSTPRPTRTALPPSPASDTVDKILETDEVFWDRNTGCYVYIDSEGFDGDLNIIISGDRQNDLKVDVYRPGAINPLRATGRFDDVFEDSNEPFIWQYYSSSLVTPNRLFRLAIELDGGSSLLAWSTGRTGDQVMEIYCHGSVPAATRTPRPTVTRRATATMLPTRTPPPTSTSVPSAVSQSPLTEVRTGLVHQDAATGCNVLVLVFPPEQENWKDLWIFRDGEYRHDVRVDISLANSDSPLYVDNEFEDHWESGEPGVWQTYSPFNDWRDGLYHIELGLHDATSTLTWRLDGPGYYQIAVSCYEPAGPAPSV
ncbi:MAG: SH3 domain-containing protein [Anaerolineaceae bacterium]|nr:SH3 domain-containing protein [Anaerolineaceae bacterium]MDE0327582.1 SH3 domain-containing protein [Anaerolineaceae bacterium]